MRRVIAIAAAGLSLAGCSSFSTDYFKSTPSVMQIQLESTPPGAEARTSLGPGCKTPCSVSVTVPEGGFSVSYTLNQFQPVTIPVQVSGSPGSYFHARDDENRSQSGGRATATDGSAEVGPPDHAAEKAEKTQEHHRGAG